MSLKYNIINESISTNIYFKNYSSHENPHLNDIKLLLENNAYFNVFPNDIDLQSTDSYKNVSDYILRIVKNSEFLCQNLYYQDIVEGCENSDFAVVIGGWDLDGQLCPSME